MMDSNHMFGMRDASLKPVMQNAMLLQYLRSPLTDPLSPPLTRSDRIFKGQRQLNEVLRLLEKYQGKLGKDEEIFTNRREGLYYQAPNPSKLTKLQPQEFQKQCSALLSQVTSAVERLKNERPESFPSTSTVSYKPSLFRNNSLGPTMPAPQKAKRFPFTKRHKPLEQIVDLDKEAATFQAHYAESTRSSVPSYVMISAQDNKVQNLQTNLPMSDTRRDLVVPPSRQNSVPKLPSTTQQSITSTPTQTVQRSNAIYQQRAYNEASVSKLRALPEEPPSRPRGVQGDSDGRRPHGRERDNEKERGEPRQNDRRVDRDGGERAHERAKRSDERDDSRDRDKRRDRRRGDDRNERSEKEREKDKSGSGSGRRRDESRDDAGHRRRTGEDRDGYRRREGDTDEERRRRRHRDGSKEPSKAGDTRHRRERTDKDDRRPEKPYRDQRDEESRGEKTPAKDKPKRDRRRDYDEYSSDDRRNYRRERSDKTERYKHSEKDGRSDRDRGRERRERADDERRPSERSTQPSTRPRDIPNEYSRRRRRRSYDSSDTLTPPRGNPLRTGDRSDQSASHRRYNSESVASVVPRPIPHPPTVVQYPGDEPSYGRPDVFTHGFRYPGSFAPPIRLFPNGSRFGEHF